MRGLVFGINLAIALALLAAIGRVAWAEAAPAPVAEAASPWRR